MDIAVLKNFIPKNKMVNKHVGYKLLFMLVTLFLFFILCAFYCSEYYNTEVGAYEGIYAFDGPVGRVLGEDDIITQDFSFYGAIHGVELSIGTYGEEIKGVLSAELWQDDVRLAQGKQDLSEISDCIPFEVIFDSEIDAYGQNLTLKLSVSNIGKDDNIIFLGELPLTEEEAEEMQEGEAIEETQDFLDDESNQEKEQKQDDEPNLYQALAELRQYSNDQKNTEFSRAFLNEKKIDGAVGINVVGYSESLIEAREVFITAAVLLGFAIILFEGVILFFHLKVENLFLVTALVLCFFYQFITIPISVPDEDAHLTVSYNYSDLLLGKDSAQELIDLNEDLKSDRTSDVKILDLAGMIHRDSYLEVLSMLDEKDVGILTIHSRPMNITPVSYVPGILGITLGRLLELPTLQAIYLGRFFQSFAYIALCYFGIKKIPHNKVQLALIALLPISLHLASSFSYDSLLLGGAIFYTGLIFYLYQKQTPISSIEIGLLVMSILILTSGKRIYVIMLATLFLIPISVWGGKLKQKLYLTAFGSVVILSFIVNMGALLMPTQAASGEVKNMSMSIIWEKPIDFIFLFVNTLLQQIDSYFRGLFGASLGWFQVNVPTVVAVFAFLLIIASTLYRPADTLTLNPVQRAVCISVFLLISAAFFAVAIGWNAIDATLIAGVQGRYFLPIMAFLLYSISGWKQLELKKDVSRYLILGMVGVNVFTLIFTLNNFLMV